MRTERKTALQAFFTEFISFAWLILVLGATCDGSENRGLSLHLPEHGMVVYVETDRQTIVAIGEDGEILWTVKPSGEDLFKVLNEFPDKRARIVAIERLDAEIANSLDRIYHSSKFVVRVWYESQQFWGLDINEGRYSLLGSN